MSPLDAATLYVRLGLTIDRLAPGYVDAYFGPPELRAAVEAEPQPSVDGLAGLADGLEAALAADPGLTDSRRTYLAAELGAMRTTIRILRGDVPDLVDEVHSLYGVRPQWVEEAVFDDAHRALNALLPGPEPLAQRVADFRARARVSTETAAPILRELAADLRERARRAFALPAEEECAITFVQDKPWYAYNWFLGNARSRFEINQDLPLEILDLPNLVSHEAYPGHHTEFSLKETRLYREEGCLEQSLRLSNTPAALIAEGIATNALRAVAAPDEIAAMLRRGYAAAGLSASDAERAPDFLAAMRPLRRVIDNQVWLLYREHVSADEFMAYSRRFGLTEEAEARHELRFVSDPLGRSYTYNYTLGRDLIASFLDAAPDPTRAFARLLSEPWTPAQIQQTLAAGAA